MRHFYLLGPLLAACVEPRVAPANIAHTLCPVPAIFDHAICACGDLDDVGTLRVLSGSAGTGSVGVNGSTHLVSQTEIAGSLDAYGGLSSTDATIGKDLHSAADVDITGTLSVDGDASIGGNLDVVGDLAIGGALGVAGDETIVGTKTIGAHRAYAASPPPCSCDGTVFDVGGAVAAARDAAGGRPSWDHVGDSELHLPSGNYYVTSSEIVGATTFVIDGKAAVYVDGSLDAIGATRWQLAPGAELDLFVSGSISSVGNLVAGDEMGANRFRLYVGGDDSDLELVGTGEFFGTIFAPTTAIHHVGDLHVVGSLLARTIDGVGTLTVEYATPLSAPSSCSTDHFE